MREFPGDYTAYQDFREREENEKTSETPIQKVLPDAPKSNLKSTEDEPPHKLTFKEKRELETLETQIAAAETRTIEIENLLKVHATDAGKLNELFTEQQNLTQQLERDLESWTKLAERYE